MPRSRLGPLAIETKLGDQPSQSCVWRAIHVQLQKSVAVKIFSSPFGSTPEARTEFVTEWEQLKRLTHSALVRCYGGGFEDNDAYLAYELIEGESLVAQVERRSRLSWESVLELAEPIVDGLRYLHEHEIYHGAIQPDKILIAGLSPILIDIRTNRFASPFKTSRPPTIQELAFRAPELTRDPSSISNQSDLYSFGATLYFALTGRPPVTGESIEEVTKNAAEQNPASPASIVMECPVWLDKLILQLLEKEPIARPISAEAVSLALAEVRRRAMSRTGVAEHASAGFSPLSVTDQGDRDTARSLLGRGVVNVDEFNETPPDWTPWHDKAWFLVGVLAMMLLMLGYAVWPLSEVQLRHEAEALIAQDTQSALVQAKNNYLLPMLNRFPNGEHRDWAEEQIEQIEMIQAEHALSVKLKRNLPIKNEGERLYAEALRYEQFGDTASALDQYRSIETLLNDDLKYRPYVNLARRQIAEIDRSSVAKGEAAEMIQAKLDEAQRMSDQGNVVAARQIWYSIVELYANNSNVAPLVVKAQECLAQSSIDPQLRAIPPAGSPPIINP